MHSRNHAYRLKPCALYRLFNNAGDLLYIGVASNALARVGAHDACVWFRSVSRVDLQWFEHRNAAEAAERAAIAKEKPRHNKVGNGWKHPGSRRPRLHSISELIEMQAPDAAMREVWKRIYAD